MKSICGNRMAQNGPEGDKGVGIRRRGPGTDRGGLARTRFELVNFWQVMRLAHTMQGVHR